jgi:hypothetical protein
MLPTLDQLSFCYGLSLVCTLAAMELCHTHSTEHSSDLLPGKMCSTGLPNMLRLSAIKWLEAEAEPVPVTTVR